MWAMIDENYEIPQRGDGGQLDLKSSLRAPETAQLDELQTFVGSKKTTSANLTG